MIKTKSSAIAQGPRDTLSDEILAANYKTSLWKSLQSTNDLQVHSSSLLFCHYYHKWLWFKYFAVEWVLHWLCDSDDNHGISHADITYACM